MKVKRCLKVLALGLFAVSVSAASAQVTITKADMPVAGGDYIYSTSYDSIDLAKTGANLTWDFSKITPVTQDTYKYVPAMTASILYALQYNGDAALDLKIPEFPGAFAFFKTSASEYTQEGLGFSIPQVPVPIPVPYSHVDVVYRFPLTYGDIDSASYAGATTISTYSIKIQGKRTNIVDGWGKIITPHGTYDCIRVKSIINEFDTVLVAGINRSSVEYKWLSPSEKIPVFEAIVTNSIIGGTITTLTYPDSYKNIVNPNGPSVSFDVANTNVFTGDVVTFDNTTQKALTYNWVITPSSYSYSGGTDNSSKNPQIVFNAPGLYTVSLNATGIGGSNYLTKTNYIHVTHNSGIATENNIARELQLYPNPTLGNVLIGIGSGNHAKNCCISVISATGKTVRLVATDVSDGLIALSIKGLAPGLYFIRIRDGSHIFEGKVVKQ